MTKPIRRFCALALGFAGGVVAPLAVYLAISHFSRPAVAQPVKSAPALGRHLPSTPSQ